MFRNNYYIWDTLDFEKKNYYKNLKNRLSKITKNNYFTKKYEKIFFFLKKEALDNSYQQSIVNDILLNSDYFNHALLRSLKDKKKLICALPVEWNNYLDKNYLYSVNKFINNLLFNYLIFKKVLKGFIIFFKITFLEYNFFKYRYNEKYHQFCGLTDKSTLPYDTTSKTLVNWFIEEILPKNEKKNIKHNLNVKDIIFKDLIIQKSKTLLPTLKFSSKISLIKWFIKFIFFNILNPSIKILYIFDEIIMSKKAYLLDKKNLAESYIFTISSYSMRPLWTYITEKKGSKIYILNYSASFEGYKSILDGYEESLGYDLMNWPIFINWTKEYNEHLSKVYKNCNFVLSSRPIYYCDTKFNIKFDKKKKVVAIFDIPPNKKSFSNKNLDIYNYRTLNLTIQFLKNILDIALLKDMVILHKPKRNYFERYDKFYFDYLQQVSTENINYNYINSNVSPERILKLSDFSINAPWSSTAFISKYLKIKTAFYDPSGTIQLTDRGSQNIQLLKTLKDLEIFMDR